MHVMRKGQRYSNWSNDGNLSYIQQLGMGTNKIICLPGRRYSSNDNRKLKKDSIERWRLLLLVGEIWTSVCQVPKTLLSLYLQFVKSDYAILFLFIYKNVLFSNDCK